jgi:hypothetical protein
VEELRAIHKILVVSLSADGDHGRTPEVFELILFACAWLTHYRVLGDEKLIFQLTTIISQSAAKVVSSKLYTYVTACIDKLRSGLALETEIPCLFTIKAGIFYRRLNPTTSAPLKILCEFLPSLFINNTFYWSYQQPEGNKSTDFRTLTLDWERIVAVRVEPKVSTHTNVLDFDVAPYPPEAEQKERCKTPVQEEVPVAAPPAELRRVVA